MRYGATSANRAPYILPHIQSLNPLRVLDYGCGQSKLYEQIEALGPKVSRYDPAIPELANKPQEEFDLVLNIDVMEHLPENEIDGFISEIKNYSKNVIFIIDTIPAKTFLPDGQNAHLTVKPPEWWRERLLSHFEFVEPIYLRPRWRAAFRTWPSTAWEKPQLYLMILRHKILKTLKR
jgi:2-polyprenyl-3-methyl-5-hydroxy-6-metoxy-1,4-benzoquinol methylase